MSTRNGIVFVETRRLAVRRFTPADLGDLAALHGDAEVMRYINGGVAIPLADVRDKTLPSFIAGYQRLGGLGFFATEEKTSGEFLGWFHLHPPAEGGQGELLIGWRLKTSAWGKGYATEGAVAIIARAFELGCPRVEATALVANAASIRVMEKAGMQFIEEFTETRFHGADQRAVRYAKTAGPRAA